MIGSPTSLRGAKGATIIRALAAISWGSSVIMSSTADVLEKTHASSARVTGNLSIALERRRINPETLRALASTLRSGADDLIKLASELEQKNAAVHSNRH